MTEVGLILGLVMILIAGFGVTLLLKRSASEVNGLECFCLSWLLGCGVVSILLFICSMAVSGLPLLVLVAIYCAGIGYYGWRVSRNSSVQFRFPLPATAMEYFLAAIMIVEIAMIFFICSKVTLGWDGLINWEIKARYAFLNGGSLTSGYYQSDSRAFTHPHYPLMIPMTELWLYLWMAEPNQGWVRIIFPLFYATGAILLAILSGRLAGRAWPGYVAGISLFLVPILTGENGAVVGYADFPLGVLYLAAVGYLLLFLVRGENWCFFIYSVLLALLPWMKREGMILWLVAALAGGLVLWRRRCSYRFWGALISTVVILVAWRIYLTAVGAVKIDDFQAIKVETLWMNATRVSSIGRELLVEMMRSDNWSLFWPIALIAFLYRVVRCRDTGSVVLGLTVFAPVGIYSCTYLLSAHHDYLWHIGTSLPRLLMQVVPVAWLMIALVMRPPEAVEAKVEIVGAQ